MTLAREIRDAALARNADLVLTLWSWSAESEEPMVGPDWTDAAEAVLALAERLRLPHGRHGAWAKHLQLLELVCRIAESGKAEAGEQDAVLSMDAAPSRALKLLGRPSGSSFASRGYTQRKARIQ